MPRGEGLATLGKKKGSGTGEIGLPLGLGTPILLKSGFTEGPSFGKMGGGCQEGRAWQKKGLPIQASYDASGVLEPLNSPLIVYVSYFTAGFLARSRAVYVRSG